MPNEVFSDFGPSDNVLDDDIIPFQRGTSPGIYRYFTPEQLAAFAGATFAVWGQITGSLSDQTDLQTALNNKVSVGGNISQLTNNAGYITSADLTGYLTTATAASTYVPKTITVNSQPLSANVVITKSDVGLGNCDNTSDANKPVSTAQASAIAVKITANGAITGATKTKITYDANGLVTVGADATTADIADSSNKRYVTDANLVVIGNTSGTNSGNVSISSANGLSLVGQALSMAVATTGQLGTVRPDGTTITITGGVISSVGLINPVAITGGTIDGTAIGRTSTSQSLPIVVSVTGSSKTLAITDANTIQGCSNAATQAITIPANTDVAFDVNTVLIIQQQGLGTVTATGATGVTVNGTAQGSVQTTGQYSALYLIKTGTNTWLSITGVTGITGITGDVTASGVGSVSAVVSAINGKSITLGGALSTVGAFDTAFTMTAATNLTLPTSGSLLAGAYANAISPSTSQSMLLLSGTMLTGGTGTTTFPALYFNQGATPINTFSTSGTYIGVNAASGFAGNFIDLQTNNGGSLFKVSSGGAITTQSTIAAGGAISGTNITGTGSLIAGSALAILFTSRSRMTSPADAQMLFQNNGSSGICTVFAGRQSTAKTSNYTVLFSDANTVFNNTSAAGEVDFTLPVAANMMLTFIVTAAQTLKIIAGSGGTIRLLASVSTTAGNISSNTIGNTITLFSVSTTSWVAIDAQGTWTTA